MLRWFISWEKTDDTKRMLIDWWRGHKKNVTARRRYNLRVFFGVNNLRVLVLEKLINLWVWFILVQLEMKKKSLERFDSLAWFKTY